MLNSALRCVLGFLIRLRALFRDSARPFATGGVVVDFEWAKLWQGTRYEFPGAPRPQHPDESLTPSKETSSLKLGHRVELGQRCTTLESAPVEFSHKLNLSRIRFVES